MAAEKRGNLVKLTYDFDTSAMLEVKLGDKWYRTTAKRFRSFDGERRISGPDKQPGHGIEAFQNVKIVTNLYEGPVFVFDTNMEVPFRGTGKYIESPEKVLYPDPEKFDTTGTRDLKKL